MKPRTVFVTLELLTPVPLRVLRELDPWIDADGFLYVADGESYVEQVHVNVAKPKPTRMRRAKR